MSLTSSKEVISSSKNTDVLKISSLEEFKRHFEGMNVEGIETEFKTPLITSMGEIKKIREELTIGETSGKLKKFLESKGVFGKIGAKFENAQKIFNEKIKTKEALEALENGDESYSEKISAAFNEVGDNKGAEKAKVVFSKTSESIKSVKESAGVVAIFEWLKNIFTKFLSWTGLDKLFNLGDKTKEIVEKLNPEEVEKTKEKTEKVIVDTLGEHLTDSNKVKLQKSLEKLTQDELNSLAEKMKAGELSFYDIKEVIPNIFNEILDAAQIEKIKSDFKKNIIDSIKLGVQENYNHNITDEKLIELEKLIDNNTNFSDENIATFIEVNKKQELLINDIFGPLGESIMNITSILIGLLFKRIIPVTAFGLDFAKSSGDVVKIGLNSVGISEHINLDTFNKEIDKLSEKERAILVGLLYRKGGLFFNIMGSISEVVTRTGIEFVAKSDVKRFDLLKASFKGDHLKQIENFKKIAKKLNVPNTGSISILTEAVDNVGKIITNYEILNIFEKAGNNTGEAIEGLKKIKGVKIPSGITEKTPIKQLMKTFGSAPVVTADSLRLGGFTSELGFGKNADLFGLNKKIEAVAKSQKSMFNGNLLSKIWTKRGELLNIGDISRQSDKVIFHFDSIEKAKESLSKWNVVANKAPDLIKGIFDKLPIIAITGLAANSDKPFIEEFQNQLNYLLPILGPVLIIKDSGISWKNGDLNIINPIEAGIGGALIGLDTFFLLKEIGKGKGAGRLIRGGKYMVKPIGDLYSLGKGTLEGGYTIGKAIGKGKGIKEIVKKAVTKTNSIKKPKLRTIAILGVIAYLGLDYAFSDDEDLKEYFDENGNIDKEKLKKEINNPEITDEDKELLLKYLVAEKIGEKDLENIEISIKNNVLSIVSKSSKYKGDWIIEGTLDLLQLEYNGNFKCIA